MTSESFEGTTLYDDTGWSSGPGAFGFGTGSPSTNTQAAMLGITPSFYARIVFNATSGQAGDAQPLKLIVANDDGFVAYLNGVEVARRNVGLPNTFTPFDAVADTSRNTVASPETITLDAANRLLVSGSNVLSIIRMKYYWFAA